MDDDRLRELFASGVPRAAIAGAAGITVGTLSVRLSRLGLTKPGRADYGEVSVGADYSADEAEFLQAVDAWKRKHRKPFPTCTDVLRIARQLGYRKEPK